MALIVAVPKQDGPWKPFQWTPCRSRPPMMVRYDIGGEWFRDGFDPDAPLSTGAVQLGVVLWFDDHPEFGGIVPVALALRRAGLSLKPTFREIVTIVQELHGAGMSSEVTIEP